MLKLVLFLALLVPHAAFAAKPAPAEVAYFTKLLARAETAPIEDFLHLWFPQDIVSQPQDYLATCANFATMDLARGADGQIRPECQPDVLYSWGPIEKAMQLKKDLPEGGKWVGALNGGRFIYATISPVSTYSYGLLPIRFKFKKTAKFESGFSDNPNAVSANIGSGLMDFIFDNGRVIESWSFGQPEHYDEIVKDIRNFMKSTEALGYSRGQFAEASLDNVYSAGVPERAAQNEANLRRNLSFLIRMILENKGEVHFAQGVPASVSGHFATEKPTYFNER